MDVYETVGRENMDNDAAAAAAAAAVVVVVGQKDDEEAGHDQGETLYAFGHVFPDCLKLELDVAS